MDKYYYRITLQYPEDEKIIEHDMCLDKEVSLYAIPSIAIDNGIIDVEEVNFITSITQIKENESKAQFRQANQIVLKPRENYGTGKQFSHLMKDLQITDDEYTVMMDIDNITKDEITILVYPNDFVDVDNMKKCTINKAIRILNLNPTKIVSVNYLLLEDFIDEKNKCTKCSHPDIACDDCSDGECDCCDECECKDNPELDCCKACEITNDCGCYITKMNRHEFVYKDTACNAAKNIKDEAPDKNIKDEAPEKTLRIPIEPVNPNEEIIMLANAISKRLKIGFESYASVEINVCRTEDGSIESYVSIHRASDEVHQLR